MKISIAISILILALAAIMGWNNHQRIQGFAETHLSLANEAAALGLSIDMKDSGAASFVTKREREDKVVQARLMAKELIAFALESEKFEESAEQSLDYKKINDLMLSLDESQLKILIAVLRSDTQMKNETRRDMIFLAIRIFVSDDPKAALTLLTEGKGMLDIGKEGAHLLNDSLVNWAISDPDGALEWFLKNGENYPALTTEDIKLQLLKGVAFNNISSGFKRLEDLKFENPVTALLGLAGSAGSPAERTEFLKLYLKIAPEKNKSNGAYIMTMHSLAGGIGADGFEKGSRWMAENDLSEDERNALARGIIEAAKSSEKGLWIEWMGANLSSKVRDGQIYDAMQSWTDMDFRAAGEWLEKAPDSNAKTVAVAAYARTVAPYDPKVAAQWALTLPPSETRKTTLSNVYKSWQKDKTANTAERDAFMAENPAK